jgi:hypothetical protein
MNASDLIEDLQRSDAEALERLLADLRKSDAEVHRLLEELRAGEERLLAQLEAQLDREGGAA